MKPFSDMCIKRNCSRFTTFEIKNYDHCGFHHPVKNYPLLKIHEEKMDDFQATGDDFQDLRTLIGNLRGSQWPEEHAPCQLFNDGKHCSKVKLLTVAY